jgi:prepilin-type N-terminal cleavage/methylation domain-containing protein
MHRRDQRVRRIVCGQVGFTLFEIIVVLLILGVISYFVATRLFSADVPTHNAEMELVKNHLRYAQSRAMNSELSWGIKLGTASRYWLFNTTEGENAVKRLPGVESADAVMELATIQVTLPPGNKITFDSFGRPVDSSGIPVGSTLNLTAQVKGGGSTVGTITVTKNTGFIP